ncbi:MAG TPA: patatin-like phospholipase family protein [Myxococcota bacterium]|nr:patatin-like phospholipase family protein [Myxococcota bacterium]
MVAQLRYVLNFAKLTQIRDQHGVDHDVREALGTHAWKVSDRLRTRLEDEDHLGPAVRVLPGLLEDTKMRRRVLVDNLGIDPARIDHEVTVRKLVLVLGGGGGAGFGYAGLLTQLHRADLQPELIVGTSIGSLLGCFRARTRVHDLARLVEANKRLSWSRVFSLGPEPSRYGLPATMRLHLRRAIGEFLLNEEGRVMALSELEIPFYVVATGLTVDALKHDLGYYEHFLDDVVKPGFVFRASRLRHISKVANLFKEFASTPEALRKVVFGFDPGTEDVDCIDATGFSCSVPGLLHYDVHRDDQRMKHLLDQLYADYGITRLTEGGVVDNVPARVAFKAAMQGRLEGHRNCFILAVDCFAPRPSTLIFYPIQQVARANVIKSRPYANIYLPLSRTLSPLNLVPKPSDVARASRWAMRDLEPHLPLIKSIFTPYPALEAATR